MFYSIWSKTLREYRNPILGWGLGLALTLIAAFAAYAQQGSQSAASMNQLMQTIRLFGDPVSLDTPAGLTTLKILDLLAPIGLSIWALLAGARMVRGEEERGSLDLLLATPTSRLRLLGEKLCGLILALIIVGLLLGLGAVAGEASAQIPQSLGRALLTGLNVSLCAFFFAAVAIFLSQFFLSRGTAAGITGSILALSFLLDASGRSIQNGEWLQRFSPLYYYDRNKPLIDSYASHPGDAAILLALALILCILSGWLFMTRDLGGVSLSRLLNSTSKRTAIRTIDRPALMERAYRAFSTWSVTLHTLSAQLTTAFWWLIGIVAYTAWITMLSPGFLKPFQDIIKSNPTLALLLRGQSFASNTGFIGYAVFQFIPLIAIIYGLTQALKWSTDLDTGRMELVLSTPHGRTRILNETFVIVLLQVILTPILIWLAIMIGANLVNLQVDAAKVAAAAFGILPMELLIVCAIYAGAGRFRSTLILTIVTLYLAYAFLIEWMHSILSVPDWVYSLSIFHAYGDPISNGWQWTANLVMTIIALLLFIISIVQFRSGDRERGNA